MKIIIKYILLAIIIVSIAVLGINFYVIQSTNNQINIEKDNLGNVDSIIILGAGIRNGKQSPMLEDRLNEGIKLYKEGIAPKIIMSGDHSKKDYDEVNIMKEYAIEQGVPSKDIFMDHAGFSTYESIYRAKEIFKVNKIVVVTQKYHLYRAIYIAKALGLEVYGVASDPRQYVFQEYRELREIFARDKDFFTSIFKPKPTYLGEKISLDASGDITNDK